MATIANSSLESSPSIIMKQKACIPCRTRKVKCNRESPCLNCSRWSIECTYPSPVRQHRNTTRSLNRTLETRENENQADFIGSGQFGTNIDVQKLQCRRLLIAPDTKLGLSKSNGKGFSHSHMPSNRDDADQRKPNNLVILPAISEHSPTKPKQESTFVSLLPLQIRACWQTFIQFVDPVMKIVHKTTAEMIIQAYASSGVLKGDEEALALVIIYSALSVMSENEIQIYFTASKVSLLAQQSMACETALDKLTYTDAIRSSDFTAIQAIILFWTLKRKIHSEKIDRLKAIIANWLAYTASQKLPPFQQEMYNRLAWHLWYLDYRPAVEDARNICPPEPATMPLNVDDDQLWQGTKNTPSSSIGWTDMSFMLMQYQMARVSCQVEGRLGIQEKEDLISETEGLMSSSYSSHLETTSAIAWLSRHVNFVHIMELRFKLRAEQLRLSRHQSQTEVDVSNLILASVDILDLPQRIRNEPHSSNWTWLLPGVQHFLSLRFLLSELCIQPPKGYMIEYAWSVVDIAFSRWSHGNGDSQHYTMMCSMMDQLTQKRMGVLVEQALWLPNLTPNMLDKDTSWP